jgi:hypothetical protein
MKNADCRLLKKRVRAEAREKSASGGVLSEYGVARRSKRNEGYEFFSAGC